MRKRSIFQQGLVIGALLVGLTAGVAASKRIVVDLTNQIAIAYQDGKIKFYGRISSGKPGRETPTGIFYVREKDIDHVSNLWPKPDGGAKMHYMLRLTRDGIAMHLGPTPDYPASHGCIRMQDGFAQKMFAWADKGIPVDIIGTAPAHSPAVRLPAYARSSKVLRRSIGGSARGPLAVISSNPKDHQVVTEPLVLTPEDQEQAPKQHTSTRHQNPLDTISSNPRIQKRSLSSPRKKRAARRIKRKRKSRHPNPLEVIS